MSDATQSDWQFWWTQLRWPLLAFVTLATLCVTTSLDTQIAYALFYDPSHGGWLGAGNWWVKQFLHTGGRWSIRFIVLLSLLFWIASFMDAGVKPLRRTSAYLFIAMLASVAAIGLLKTLTNVDCPWDLTQFGGRYPLVGLLADRPDALRPGHCFPAAHASSGYALMALYFAFRDRHRGIALAGLSLGILTGVTFGIAQQSRGAHFLSHDIWSAFLVWLILLSMYVFAFKRRTHMVSTADDTNAVSPYMAGDRPVLDRRSTQSRPA